MNQIPVAHRNALVRCTTAYFYWLLGGRNFDVSSLIFTKSSSFMDPSHTKSLSKVKQKGEPDKINFLLRKEEKSLLQNT